MKKTCLVFPVVVALFVFGAGCNTNSQSGNGQANGQNIQNQTAQNSQTAENNDTDTLSQPADRNTYTLEDVAMHASQDDCWLAIEGKVYDVTSMIGEHPGGEAILNGCGKEATAMFEGIKRGQGHSQKAVNWLADLYKGELK